MSYGRAVLVVERAWPWGLVVVTDPASSELVPTELDEGGVAAGRSVVASSILHEVDGEAVAEVWLGPGPGELSCAYEGDFKTASGAVIVGDAADLDHRPAEIGEGAHRLRVLVDEFGSPGRVVFEFSAPID